MILLPASATQPLHLPHFPSALQLTADFPYGLVQAEPDPSHRRQILIKLTEKGRKLERPLKLEALAVNQAAAAKISASDLEAFRRTIRLLLETLEERTDA